MPRNTVISFPHTPHREWPYFSLAHLKEAEEENEGLLKHLGVGEESCDNEFPDKSQLPSLCHKDFG